MVRTITYKMQEQAYGGLRLATKRRLRSLAQALQAKGAGAPDPALTPKPGTRLIREWHGQTYTVLVLADEFEHDGRRCRSLTQIAEQITGSHRSGPVFFGLKQRNARAAKEVAK